jgi:hypothetical protein
MIKKTLITTLLLIVFYTVIVMYYKPGVHVALHAAQKNMIKAQNFLYANDSSENIIVGSSLADRLQYDTGLSKFRNLSFDGLSIFDGLTLLLQKKQFPENVYIEMNVVFRPPNNDFTSSLSNPFLFYLRKDIPSFRSGKQPLVVMGGLFSDMMISIFDHLTHSVHSRLPSAKQVIPEVPLPKKMFDQLLAFQIESYNNVPDNKQVEEIFALLKQDITLLKQKKVKIIFFEMPVDPQLSNLPVSVTIRNEFFKYFPRDQYQYVNQPDCTQYKTTDGVHLANDYVPKYVAYFKSAINK